MFQLRKLKQRRLIAKNIVYRVALCNVLRPFCFLTCVSAGPYSEGSAGDNVDRGTCTRCKRVWDEKSDSRIFTFQRLAEMWKNEDVWLLKAGDAGFLLSLYA